MTPAESSTELLRRIAVPVDRLTTRQGIDAMLAFYADQRADGVHMDEDGDMLLFQWGVYSFSEPPTFQINLTRQFILPEEDEPYQLSLTFHYAPSDQMKALKEGNRWCHSTADLPEFTTFIDRSAAVARIPTLNPSKGGSYVHRLLRLVYRPACGRTTAVAVDGPASRIYSLLIWRLSARRVARHRTSSVIQHTAMSNTKRNSFHLKRPQCPKCHGYARLDVTPANFWARVPLAAASALILYPLVGISFRCSQCGCRFVASRDTTATGGVG